MMVLTLQRKAAVAPSCPEESPGWVGPAPGNEEITEFALLPGSSVALGRTVFVKTLLKLRHPNHPLLILLGV